MGEESGERARTRRRRLVSAGPTGQPVLVGLVLTLGAGGVDEILEEVFVHGVLPTVRRPGRSVRGGHRADTAVIPVM